MASETFRCEITSSTAWPVRAAGATADVLIEQIRAHLAHDPVVDPFAVVFDEPVPLDVRERITATVLEAIKAHATTRWGFSEWVDDLVDESGWQGVRASIDPALAPCFAGADEEGDRRHAGVWADERTFLHVEIQSLDRYGLPETSWDTAWVRLAHWHPGSMTSGSWSDELFQVGPEEGASVLVGVRHMDEDGRYYSLSPRVDDATASARVVADFIEESWIGGVAGKLIPLVAFGFPADGSASSFVIDLLPGADNEGYELSSLRITPPADVMEALLSRAAIDARAARRMREAIVRGVKVMHGPDGTLADLDEHWQSLLARLGDEAYR